MPISMGTNQTGKRFYQVKVKSLDTTSIKELGRLMEPLQMQAFRKTYGKILELTTAEVSIEAIASLTQYYDQPLRCFTFGDFQLVPTIEEFEEILGCPLRGRKPYLSSGCLPSLSRIATVVKDSSRGLDRIKQTRNGIAGLPRKYLEDKAKDMASQGDWVPFMDVLALLIFGVVLFPNVDGLVDLAAIDTFLAYHHSKESPVVAVLADLFDTFDRRCEKSSARIICCLPALCVWLVSHLFQQDTRHPCPLLSYRSCTEKRRIDWDQLLAGIGGRTINWFPRWKEGKEGVLFSCGGYPNIPLIGTRGCINYNPALAIRQLGYPMRGAPTEEGMSPFLVRDFGAQNSKTIQRIHKAWETPLRKDQELRGIRNGIIGGYHEWLKVHIRGLDWLAKLKVVSEESFEASEEDEEAMLGMRQLMEKNAATAAVVSSAAEADPTLLATAHHPLSNIVGRGRDTLGHDGSPHLGYNRAAYPYGLPPNYSPPVLQDDAGHIASPILEREPPQQPEEVHKDPQDYARREVEFYPPIPEGPAPSMLPQPNIATQPIRWRDLAAQVAPPMVEREMITMMVDTLPVFYYEKLVGYMPSSFADLVFVGERIEVGLKRGKFDYVSSTSTNAKIIGATGAKRKEGDAHAVSSTPVWVKPQQTPHGTHQYAQHHPSFSAHTGNASSSAPREAPQVPTPNTTRPAGNSNTTRNFPPRPFQEFTPLPMTYEDLLPSLIANHLAVVTPRRVLQPPFPKWYDPNATCKYHGVMMARVMLLNGYEPEMGLGKDNGGITSLINAKGNRGKYGLGYKPTQADIKRSIAGRKSGGQSSRWGQESEGSPPCHKSRSFISAGLGDKGQVVVICEDDVPSTLDLVRPCPPDFQLGNWRVEERPGIYATSIMKWPRGSLPQRGPGRIRRPKGPVPLLSMTVTALGALYTSSASRPSRDGRFSGNDVYTDFQEEIGRRRWTSLVTPMAKFDPEIVLEFYANAWPTEEGVRDMRSWVRGQWIPFDADAIGQLLGYPLVLEEGQECEYGQRRNRSDAFDEEAIAQLLCIPGQDFSRTAAGRRIWMTLLLSNILPSDHNSDLPLPKCQLVYAILTRMSIHVA
ncbi:hypothetical protein HKD37_01G000991 [Glycine soja]